jgi:acetylornithine/succinyldiaminopimelate/putrescine aminotransferase
MDNKKKNMIHMQHHFEGKTLWLVEIMDQSRYQSAKNSFQ